MGGGEIKLKERLQGLAAIAALPSAAIGVVGDVFSPVGGSVVVAAAGMAALCTAVVLLATMTVRGQKFYETVWARMTVDTDDARWIWNPARPWTSHALHVVSVFGVICLLIAGKSFAASDGGGVLASNVSAVSVAQQQMGISEKLYAEVQKTNQALERIDTKADNFKRERSDDPRKELLNSGVMWEAIRLERAIADGDIRTVDLFLRGGMPVSPMGAAYAFELGSPDIAVMVAKYPSLFDAGKCPAFLARLDTKAILAASPHAAKLVRSLCANDVARAYAKEKLESAEGMLAAEVKTVREEEAQRKPVGQCMRDLANDKNLFGKAMETGVRMPMGGLSDYDVMLYGISHAASAGRTDFSQEIRAFCEKQVKLPKRDNSFVDAVKSAEKLADWVG
ncbi:hypothetical protein HHL21_02415 [Massilia sp. RP-1-19]|uniref:Uncharacterized protein n=1 Tax=Massilia polaris TaxID=2728846 RepID=A0A848HET2_9BURK|nr:hypothetical protein [Massilia polaris]NML59955.1 hypothetical protein [Massilia polaris]